MLKRIILTVSAFALLSSTPGCGGDSTTVINSTVAVTTTVSETTTSTSADTGAVFIQGVVGQGSSQPTNFSFSVDGDLSAAGLAWENWGEETATGSGDFSFRDYPSTRRVVVPGSMTVSRLAECQGAEYYTDISFDLPADAPFQPLTKNILTTPCD
jgi:hypothetical protein